MLTDEQLARKRFLLDKADLTDEEITELSGLEEESDNDDFDAAFEEAIGDAAPSEEGQDDGEQEGPDSEESESDEEDDVPGEQQPQDNEDPQTSVDTDSIDYWKSQTQKMEQKMASWEGRISAANRRAEEAERRLKDATKTQQTGQSQETPPEPVTDDADLSAFVKEFPDLVGPIKALATEMAKKIVDAELGKLRPEVEEVRSAVRQSSTDTHIARITEAHPDWREHHSSGKLQAWIDSQPSILQGRYNDIVADGSTKEIIEMLDLYKQRSGQKPQLTNKRVKPKPEIAVPASSGGTPSTKPKSKNKDDFDSAWDEANKRP